jgi:hypothetical protein
MTAELTNQEKSAIVLQHIKNIAYSEYNTTLTLYEEQATTSPNQENILSLTSQISDFIAQKQVLQNELESLS